MKSKGSIMACLILFSFTITTFINTETISAFSNQVIQRGATGDDVVELQARLQYNGYYNGKIDGVYGWGTYWAVRNFQDQFGLKEVDGLVGAKTKQTLICKSKYYREYVMEQLNKGNTFTHYGKIPLKYQTKPSKAATQKARQQAEARQKQPAEKTTQKPKANANKQQNNTPAKARKQDAVAANMPGGFSNNDIRLLAQAVYGEARGEPYEGQVAIAAVILNRLNSPLFPNSVAGVIFEPLAFTAVADGQIYMQPNETAREAVLDAINGWDPSEEALYYFNPDTATSPWIWGRPQIKRIGKHIFCE
ncbi:spore cortex-lytic enzyme [Bacillus subtilis subsp. subtilis]|uniref:Spore cortex-lytic enzyme n=4 Tax=Bacillus subtilis TaxID=1423 RepID=SLEB_BACSU|nr:MULTISPECIES: spore cortex-lytic enzyme [Bacillales]NP_390174.1 spore germination cortex-lytic enzyme [Bacillus subtilis subsp. subtilis str. 168]P50739.1 RecName: Full=Spore cortex-lytic enzyme; Short=SCLE; Flags: Precursor [Bacillus subtilis subsp. subtilis str. 168]MDP4112132.1 spore cortex-lytic enzyme [Bacillota bacterium]BAM52777.1 spore cortex-lytic protein [Bacillus subtilis BEST7613]AAC83957.1 spore cortex lytic enzyme [Bacillus subtilis subsp. subtilis str. 168]AFQ58243.1 Spore c